MTLPPALLAVLPDSRTSYKPWDELFRKGSVGEIFDNWRRGYGSDHPQPPLDELLALYLNRHDRARLGAYYELSSYPRPTQPWPLSPEGPWPDQWEGDKPIPPEDPRHAWMCEAAPAGVLVALGASLAPAGAREDVLDIALREGWSSVVRQVLKHPDCPSSENLAARTTPYVSKWSLAPIPWAHALALSGRATELADWLAQPGMDPDQRDGEGRTPLFHATKTEVVDVLIAAGADPSARDRNGLGAEQAWLRPTTAMAVMTQYRGAAPVEERSAHLGTVAPELRAPVLFARFHAAGINLEKMAWDLDHETAELRLERPVPGGAKNTAWGPLAHLVVEAISARKKESNPLTHEVPLLTLAKSLLDPTAPDFLREWLDHETCPGLPDRALVGVLAHMNGYTHLWHETSSSLPPDLRWKAFEFLARTTREEGRRQVLEEMRKEMLMPAWGPKFPIEERRVALQRLAGLWSSQAGLGFFNAELPHSLNAGAWKDDDTIALLKQEPETASRLLVRLASMPEGEGHLHAEIWVEKGLRPLPGKDTNKFRAAFSSRKSTLARIDAAMLLQALPDTAGEQQTIRPRARM